MQNKTNKKIVIDVMCNDIFKSKFYATPMPSSHAPFLMKRGFPPERSPLPARNAATLPVPLAQFHLSLPRSGIRNRDSGFWILDPGSMDPWILHVRWRPLLPDSIQWAGSDVEAPQPRDEGRNDNEIKSNKTKINLWAFSKYL